MRTCLAFAFIIPHAFAESSECAVDPEGIQTCPGDGPWSDATAPPQPNDGVDLMQRRVETRTRRTSRDLRPPSFTVHKHIAGVPVYNYHLAYPSGREPSAVELEAGTAWMVMLKATLTDAEVHAFCEDLPGNARCTGEGHPEEHGISFVAVHATEEELNQILANHDGAEGVEPDLTVEPIPEIGEHEEGDSLLLLESSPVWGLDRIDDIDGQDQSYTIPSSGGAGTHVYVLDTGVRTTHSDFEGRAIPTLESTGMVKPCQASDTTCAGDHHGHGTHCAGTIAGKKYGVAKSAIIHAVKVLNPSGQISWITSAIDWIAANGPKPAVISMSLGGQGTSPAEKATITAAVNAGITVVVAAGNSNADACKFSPAFVPLAITVGSTAQGDTMSGFSNYGTCIDIFAPGSNIKSASHASDLGTATMSGTSMACPHVAGVAALLQGADTSRSPADIANILTTSSGKNKITNIPGNPPSPNRMLYATLENVPITPSPTPPSPTPPSPTPPSQGGSCQGNRESFNAGYGGCKTYATSNKDFCGSDKDKTTGLLAQDVCHECDTCQ